MVPRKGAHRWEPIDTEEGTVGGRHRTDELDGGYNPQYDPPPRRRAGRGMVFVPLAGAVALAVLLGVAAYVVVNKNPSCGGGKISLTVVASPDIQPAVQKVAGKFAQSGTSVDGKCVAVSVKAAGSADVANAMAGTGPTSGKLDPDVWIPDSSLWLAGLAKSGAAPKPSGSAAHSPVVLTASKAGAEKLQSAFSPASWTGLMSAANAANPDGLARKVRVLALDPTQNAAGLGALLAGATVLRQAGGSEETLVGVLRQLSESTVSTPDSLFATLTKAAARIPVGISSEQAVWAFNTKTTPSNPAVALYPTEGTVNLDYPIVVTAKDDATRKAAQAFAADLTSPAGRKTVQDYGFRTPDGKGGSLLKPENGVSAKKPAELPLPDAATVTQLSQAWHQIKLGTKLLALLDISGTMALPADSTGISRMRAVTDTAQEGLKLFPDKAEVGVWAFSDDLQRKGIDWRPVVPIGPLAQQINGVTRRVLIAQAMQQAQVKTTGNTGLNDTLWAAYQKMTKEYEPDKVNTILLFTDGVGNDDPNGGISNAQILQKLKQAYDPKQPVSILIISFNTNKDEDRAQMTNIAKATGGAAYFPQTVLEIRNIFLKGIARRLCAPNCGASAQQ
ncbi:substrate-binding and VWA domain-containing protein [Microbispora sp. ATCC PTA-5024]|uniref:substrate-binding and VWA domain-containing protein n=1 Tax=Microbispora sp. ATCC PTA-5024 TaxID=316330 RepID=UPI0003DBCF8D|nr:substrate-binding and VWA domain-containing protein [Microbispora sp. ATCC PTA-5024]ETK31559.1 ABC transporter substrate-binding protein [Microbispora sp. ATCC PTA-5024]